jgi:hypothetical protein
MPPKSQTVVKKSLARATESDKIAEPSQDVRSANNSDHEEINEEEEEEISEKDRE